MQHEKAAFLDGELKVLHVLEVAFKGAPDVLELAVNLGECDLDLGDGFRGADPGDDVLALRIQEELPVEDLFARGGVAGEGDARTAVVAGVSEDHGLHVDGRAPFVRDVIFPAVDDGPLVVPGAKHRADGAAELFTGIFGEVLAGAFADEFAEAVGQGAQGGGIQLGVGDVGIFREKLLFQLLDDDFKRLMILTRTFLYAHDHVTVHLEEAAVTVVGKALVLAAFGESTNGAVVEAEVEDGVHHAGHRVTGAGADGHEKGVGGVTELPAHGVLEFCDGVVNLTVEGGRVTAVVIVVVGADLGGDGESGGDGEADLCHLGEVGALAAEEGLHLPVAVGFAVAEEVDVFYSLGGARFLGFGCFGFVGHIEKKRLGMPAKGCFGKPVQTGLGASGTAVGRLFQADSWNDKTLRIPSSARPRS